VIKFVYIFNLKCVMALNEDFAARCITLCNIVVSGVVVATAQFLGFQNAEVDYHVCLGRDPQQTIREAFKYTKWLVVDEAKNITTFEQVARGDPVSNVVIFLFLLLFAVSMSTWIFSSEGTVRAKLSQLISAPAEDQTLSSLPLSSNYKFEETKNEIVGTKQLVLAGIVCLLLLFPHVYVRSVFKGDAGDLNRGLAKIMYYLGKMTMPLIAFFNVPLAIVLNNGKMRRSLLREVKNQLS